MSALCVVPMDVRDDSDVGLIACRKGFAEKALGLEGSEEGFCMSVVPAGGRAPMHLDTTPEPDSTGICRVCWRFAEKPTLWPARRCSERRLARSGRWPPLSIPSIRLSQVTGTSASFFARPKITHEMPAVPTRLSGSLSSCQRTRKCIVTTVISSCRPDSSSAHHVRSPLGLLVRSASARLTHSGRFARIAEHRLPQTAVIMQVRTHQPSSHPRSPLYLLALQHTRVRRRGFPAHSNRHLCSIS